MAIKEPFMGKHKTLASGADLVLQADSGESFMVKDIHVYNPANNWIEVIIDKVMVGFFRVGGDLGSHLPFTSMVNNRSHGLTLEGGAGTAMTVDVGMPIMSADGHALPLWMPEDNGAVDPLSAKYATARPLQGVVIDETVLAYLARIGVFKGYPIAEGQKLTIRECIGKDIGDTLQTQTADVYVEYEEYEGGDMSEEAPNGSEAEEYMFLSYGRHSDTVGGAVDDLQVDLNEPIQHVVTPAEFPAFPYEVDVPAKMEIEIPVILATEAMIEGDASHYGLKTVNIKLVKDRKVMFDDDRKGLLFEQILRGDVALDTIYGGGISVLGNKSSVDMRDGFEGMKGKLFMAGESLDIEIATEHVQATEGTPKQLPDEDAEIALVEIIRRVS